MKAHFESNILKIPGLIALIIAAVVWQTIPAFAKDTDIYSANAKQNAYVLMDSSGSMSFGVYEHTIDYGAMFDYLFTLNDDPVGDYEDYIWDTINKSDYFYNNHKEIRKIYLWKGDIGVTIATVDGEEIAFSGDAADPDYLWYSNDLVDTHTLLDIDGNLSDDGTGQQRITVDSDGYILLDGSRLPHGLDITAHDFNTLYNGSIVDNGFNGLLNAPGYYFSGYEGVTVGSLNPVEDGDDDVYFFVTGNWVNMQAMYNLHYTTNNPEPTGASTGDAAWPYETFPITVSEWTQISHDLDYPEGDASYTNNLSEVDTEQIITYPGAEYMQVHFSVFDVEGDGKTTSFKYDYVKIYDETNDLVAQYDNDNNPLNSDDGWSPTITGDSAVIRLSSDKGVVGTGYTIDKVRLVYDSEAGGSYLMQSRMDVAKESMLYVVDEFRGKMNWGFASFGNNEDGASLGPYLNPTDGDDAQRAAIVQQIDGVSASGGTPLMEALQDIWQEGYYGRRNVLNKLLCRKNYIISMTDGYPSADDDNTRITGVTFDDWDGDKWTQDPYQGLGDREDYYDDVANWLYTHSWLDGSEVDDPANSYVNVITHHIAFGAKHPLLQDAAGESGGEYIVAYNKEQLIAAFYSLALMMTESVSFTSPVVSVDADNKIQSGEDLYMGLFLPQDSNYWVGNIKKYKVGDGSSTDRPTLFMIYDADNNEAIDSNGQFVDNTVGFWGDEDDANDTDTYGSADITEDGAGEVLLETVEGYFDNATYWNRPIYTSIDGTITKFDRDNITATDLSVADTETRDKLINFIHGYTYDADSTTGAPQGVREWVLGAIIHSQPVVVDYYDTTDTNLPLLKRLIVVGSNDGMLHVFNDTTGAEEFAFIPEDLLPKLQYLQTNYMYETVDGHITLYRKDSNPKYLIFGERRGGSYYWNLDVTNSDPLQWTVAWSYTNSEIEQSWSNVNVASIPVAITTDGVRTYKDVAIFTGGYDSEEDDFPEPFTDQDNSGSPFLDNGNIDNSEWSKTTATQDVYDDDEYNTYNPEMNEYGRGIFVVDIDDPTAVTSATVGGTATQVLPFSVTYGASNVTTGATQTRTDMTFSFPASPSVVTTTDSYYYLDSGSITRGYQTNRFFSLYAVDIYANLFKGSYVFDVENSGTSNSPNWSITEAKWTIDAVFSGNPGSTSTMAGMVGAADTDDIGRKAFYPPSISWGGTEGYFVAGNYYFDDVTFTTKNKMASLFFGTGDREHPTYTMIRNRFYAVYDDSSVTAVLKPESGAVSDVPVGSTPYYETDLLNLTCDELGTDSVISSCYLGDLDGECDATDGSSADVDMKAYLKKLLTDDAVYGSPSALEYGVANEDDRKGWYIVLEDQGQECSHMSYASTIEATDSSDDDNHVGEKILSQAILYYGTLYFTSYQPSVDDPCDPAGNGFSYAISYLDGTATYDLDGSSASDITDRYKKFVNIKGIPSGFTIITTGGRAAAMASMGGSIIGPGPDPTNPYEIDTPGMGLELYYWRDSLSQ